MDIDELPTAGGRGPLPGTRRPRPGHLVLDPQLKPADEPADGAIVDRLSAEPRPRPRPGRREGVSAPGDPDVARNMVATIVGNLFPPLALLITAPLLAHSLGVTGRGDVAGATAPLLLITTAATLGIPQALTYAVARSPRAVRHALRHSLEIIVLASVAATVAVALSARWLSGDDAGLEQLIIVASLAILPGLVLIVLRGLASGLHRWRLVAREQLFSSVLELIALVALAFTGTLTPLTATIAIGFSPATGALAYLGLRKTVGQIPAAPPTELLGRRRQLMGFGVRVWVGALSGIILSRLDQAVMVPLSDAHQLGFYAVAVTISQIPLVINNAVRDVTFSSDASGSVNERLEASARISSAASALVGLLVGLTMPLWEPLLFGQDFRDAIPASAVLIIAVVVGTPGSIAGAGLSARGRPGLRSMSLVVASIVNVALVILFVPPFGAMGAAVATLIGNLLSANGCIFLLWRNFGVDPRNVYGLRRNDVLRSLRFAKHMLNREIGTSDSKGT